VREQLFAVCVTASALIACRAAAPDQQPEQRLKDSFVQQIASTGIVHNLKRDGDTLSFSARHVDQPDATWRVHIDSATIETQTAGTTREKGVVKSSWYVNGEPIRPRGSQSDLPLPFLDNGIAQDCWALWDSRSRQWSWK
jgi:hypothetical protein